MIRLVGGAGDIKLTKDGNTLLREMVSLFCKSWINFCFVIEFMGFMVYSLWCRSKAVIIVKFPVVEMLLGVVYGIM